MTTAFAPSAPLRDSSEPKKKYPRNDAMLVARELCAELKPFCARLIVAGSLRRRKALVGDVEILYIPNFLPGLPNDFFDSPTPINGVDSRLAYLLEHTGALTKRLSKIGSESWGEKNKLAVHVASGIPVDFFATTEAHWFNYLVCRTGSAENNIRISNAAIAKRWSWHPYKGGFTDHRGDFVPVKSERDAFSLVNLDYLEPWDR